MPELWFFDLLLVENQVYFLYDQALTGVKLGVTVSTVAESAAQLLGWQACVSYPCRPYRDHDRDRV